MLRQCPVLLFNLHALGSSGIQVEAKARRSCLLRQQITKSRTSDTYVTQVLENLASVQSGIVEFEAKSWVLREN